MARNYRPLINWFTGELDPKASTLRDKRKGNRNASRIKRGFVSWDGESVTDERGHDYVMLVSSNGDEIIRDGGLNTVECLETLLAGAERAPLAFHVGFAFSYDVNMILRDLSKELLEKIWTGQTVGWRGYKIAYKPRREFVVKHGKRAARIWDVWGFFQGRFVDALEAYKRTEFLAFIERMKEKRAEFTRRDMPEMLAYCRKEVSELTAMMDEFNSYLAEAELRITRYDGAGAVAAALLRKYGIKEYMQEYGENWQRIAAHGYFGGRIELVRYGHAPKETIYQYDLRSAYPSIIQHLPCLACRGIKSDTVSELAPEPFTLYNVYWDLDETSNVCPFPYRDRYGAIFFPRKGEGNYWAPEVEAALEALRLGVISGSIKIRARFRFVGECEHEPFSWVPELYERRAEWKRAGIGAEKVLKLGLNSLYGKTAQRVGAREGSAPTYHQLEWAGFVTSGARAKLYRASFPAILDGGLIGYATDAIFSTTPLELPESSALGDWEAAEYMGGTFVQSGVYWLGGGQVGHTRGFAKDDLSPAAIVKAWRARQAEIEWSITRFVGLGRALTGGAQWEKWRTWQTDPRVLSLSPVGTKRALSGRTFPKPHLGLITTIPAEPHDSDGVPSAPIKLPWLAQRNAVDGERLRLTGIVEDESDDCYD